MFSSLPWLQGGRGDVPECICLLELLQAALMRFCMCRPHVGNWPQTLDVEVTCILQ